MSKKSVGNVGKVYNQYTDEFRRDAVAMIVSQRAARKKAAAKRNRRQQRRALANRTNS